MRKLTMLVMLMCMMVSMVACSGGDSTTESASTAAESESSGTSGDSGTTSEEIQMVMAWWGNQVRNERTQQVLDLYSENNQGVTFDGQFSEWSDYWNKLATSAAGNALPDLIQMDYAYLGQYVESDLLVDLKPFIDSGALDMSHVSDDIVAMGEIDGGVYGIALGVNSPAFMYNKTLLDEAGITVEANMTIDEFIEVSREVYEKTGYKTNVTYQKGNNFLEYLLRGNGVDVFSDGQLGSADPGDFQPYFDLCEQGLAEGWFVSPTIFTERSAGSVEQDPLVYGSSPESRSWCGFFFSNQLSAMQNAADVEGIEIGITSWPATDVVAANYLKPSQFISIGVNTDNVEEAVKVVDYFTNSVEANDILLAERGVPVSSAVAAAISPNLSVTQQSVTAYINDVVTPSSSKISDPAPSGASEVYQLLNQLEELVCYGEISAEEAATRFVEEGSELLQ